MSSVISGEDIVAAARNYLGITFQHQGRSRKSGLDCIGLLVAIARDLGLEIQDRRDYPNPPASGELLECLERYCSASDIFPPNLQQGDIVVIAQVSLGAPNYLGHCGVISEKHNTPHLIHATERLGCVVEQPLNISLRRSIRHSFHLLHHPQEERAASWRNS